MINAPSRSFWRDRSSRPGRTGLALLCLIAVSLLVAEAPKPGVKPTEFQLKAIDLVAFGRFVEWPPRARAVDDTFDICVLGQDPFGSALDTAVRGEIIAGTSAVARRIARPQEAAGCRVLYIGSSEEAQLESVIAAVGNAPVLTVADIPNFIRRGGMIQFVLDDNRVRFEINLAVSRRAGLTLSSDMLKVARIVRKSF